MKQHSFLITLFIIICLLVLAGCASTASESPSLTGIVQTASTVTPEPAPTERPATAIPESAPTERSATATPVATRLRTVEAEQPAAPTPAPAADAVPSDAQALLVALQETLQNVYNTVNPSVVNISVLQKQLATHPAIPGMPEIPGFPFADPEGQEQPREFLQQGQGSGFVWNEQGYIVTNNHVVADADRIIVTFYDGTTIDGNVVGADPDSDLAVVKIDSLPDGIDPIKVVDSSNVKVGQLAIAIGNPFGLAGTMTVGFISALGRSLPVSSLETGPAFSIPDIIQTDAPINPGNSGGVLVDAQGQLIGVPSAIESPVRASAGIGFAISSATVQQVVPTLIEKGFYEHPWMGVSGQSLIPDVAREMGLDPSQRGALIMEVTPGGPAAKAGLRGSERNVTIEGIPTQVGGDVIVAFEGHPVKSFEDIVSHLARYSSVNQSVTLTILRDGEEQEIEVTLAARPSSSSQSNE